MNPFGIFGRKPTREDQIAELRRAVLASDTQKIRDIIHAFPDLRDHEDEKGETPLHWAAGAQSLSSVACLVDLGADTQRKDHLGYTPEQLSYFEGEFRMGAYTDTCIKICERLKSGKMK